MARKPIDVRGGRPAPDEFDSLPDADSVPVHHRAPPQPEDRGMLDALDAGAIDAATLGGAKHVGGLSNVALNRLIGYVRNHLMVDPARGPAPAEGWGYDNPEGSDLAAFRKGRAAYQEMDEQAHKQHRILYNTGGIVASSLFPSLGAAGEGASHGAKLLAAARSAGIYGTIYGMLGSKADPTKLIDQPEQGKRELARLGLDTAATAVTAAGMGALAEHIQPKLEDAFDAVGDEAKDAAAERAFRALRMTPREAAQAGERASGIGREALDRGIVKFGSGVGGMAERSAAERVKTGGTYGSTVDALNDKGVTVPLGNATGAMRDRGVDLAMTSPAYDPIARTYVQQADKMDKRLPAALPFGKAVANRQGYDRSISRFNSAAPSMNDEARIGIRGILEDENRKAALKSHAYGPGLDDLGQDYTNAAKSHSAVAAIDDYLNGSGTSGGSAARELARRTVSPSDYAAGATGLITGNPGKALELGIGNHVLRTRGQSALAVTQDRAGNAASWLGSHIPAVRPAQAAVLAPGIAGLLDRYRNDKARPTPLAPTPDDEFDALPDAR